MNDTVAYQATEGPATPAHRPHIYYDYERRAWAAEVRTPSVRVAYTGFASREAATEWTLAVLRRDRYETRAT